MPKKTLANAMDGELTNSQLYNKFKDRSDAKDLLTGLAYQRLYLLKLAMNKMPCPNCGTKQNEYEAGGYTMDEDDFSSNHTFKCIRCGRELTYDVPFIAIGPPWHWGLVPVKG